MTNNIDMWKVLYNKYINCTHVSIRHIRCDDNVPDNIFHAHKEVLRGFLAAGPRARFIRKVTQCVLVTKL